MSKNNYIDFEIYDESLKAKVNSQNENYIKSQIRDRIKRASATLIIDSEYARKSKWVKWEYKESIKCSNAIICLANGSLPLIRNQRIKIVWNIQQLTQLLKSLP